MVSFLADTNIFVRLFLRDIPEQYEKAKELIDDCKNGKIKITVLSEIIPEVEYTLRKYYKLERKLVYKYLSRLINTAYLNVENREIWKIAMKVYLLNNIDIIDTILVAESRARKDNILSFDKDFKKIKS